nr:hypothetical protein [Tanacetum cinerariifolium]
MDITIDQQVALDEALVPHASRLRIGKIHHHSIRFKMNNKKRIVNLEYFREMLQICPIIPNQQFDELPFEEEILAFLRELSHSGETKMITNVEHKDSKNINEMYYPRFTKVIVNFFMTKDQYIPRRNKVNGHFSRDDHMFTTIKLVFRHQNTQQYGAILLVELTNEAIRNSESYKEYYAIASGAEPPKTKASVRKKQSSSDTIMAPPTATCKILKTSAKVGQPAKDKQPAKSSKAKGVDEGTAIIPGVPDVPTYESNDKEISEKSSEDDDDDDQDDHDDDDEQTNSDNDIDDFVHLKFSTHDEEDKDEESFDPIVLTPSQVENTYFEDNDEDIHGINVEGDKGANEEDEANELYRDVNINLEGRDVQMADVQTTQNMLNPSPDTSIDSIFESTLRVDVPFMTPDELPLLSATTLPPPSIPIILYAQQTPAPSPANVPSSSLQDLPNFGSLFRFDHKLKTLETNFSEFMQTNQFAKAISSILDIVDKYIDHQMNEAMKVVVQLQSDRIQDDAQTASESAPAEEPIYTTQDLEEPAHQEFVTGETDDQPAEEASQHPNWFQKQAKPLTPDRACSKTLSATHGRIQPWISNLAKKSDSRSSFYKLMDTPVDFSAFEMNRLKVDTLTPKLLAGLTYELMKGSYKSIVELEFFLEEVYKATTNQLNWNNLKGQQYPHDLLKPLPLIPNSRGRRIIPFDHFINNDLEYLRGGASSRKYTTLVTKTKAADYRHIKWIEDLIPRTMESARDVYSKRRIIAVTELQIVEWHNYKHLDWITIRRYDDKLYKFKEGDFKRLCIQEIEDMLLLLIQGKLTNLTVDERFLLMSHCECTLLMAEIEKRFGGNKESNKTSKTLLKQRRELDNEDLQQIDADYLEDESKMADGYVNHESQKISKMADGSKTIGFNKTNCHKRGHFARECRAPRENRNKESVRRNVIVETTNAKALVAQDGFGYDLSDQAKDGPTNFALMAYISSGSSSSSSSDFEVSTCSKACLKSYKSLKEHYDNLSKDYKKS